MAHDHKRRRDSAARISPFSQTPFSLSLLSEMAVYIKTPSSSARVLSAPQHNYSKVKRHYSPTDAAQGRARVACSRGTPRTGTHAPSSLPHADSSAFGARHRQREPERHARRQSTVQPRLCQPHDSHHEPDGQRNAARLLPVSPHAVPCHGGSAPEWRPVQQGSGTPGGERS